MVNFLIFTLARAVSDEFRGFVSASRISVEAFLKSTAPLSRTDARTAPICLYDFPIPYSSFENPGDQPKAHLCRYVATGQHMFWRHALWVSSPLLQQARIFAAWPMPILAHAARQSKGGFSEFSFVPGPCPKRNENSCDPASRFGQPRLNRVPRIRIGSDHAAEEQRRRHDEQANTQSVCCDESQGKQRKAKTQRAIGTTWA